MAQAQEHAVTESQHHSPSSLCPDPPQQHLKTLQATKELNSSRVCLVPGSSAASWSTTNQLGGVGQEAAQHRARVQLVQHTLRNEPGSPARVASGTPAASAPGNGAALRKAENYLPKPSGQVRSSPAGHQSSFSLTHANRAGPQTHWEHGARRPRPAELRQGAAHVSLLLLDSSTAP